MTEPVQYDTAEYHVPADRSERHRRRPTPIAMFAIAFILLVLAAASVAIANFNAGSTKFAWTSIGLSIAAVVTVVASFFFRPRA